MLRPLSGHYGCIVIYFIKIYISKCVQVQNVNRIIISLGHHSDHPVSEGDLVDAHVSPG